MARATVTAAQIIQMTLDTVRSFYNRNHADTTSPMDRDFVWIGSNDFQWCIGLEEFNRITKKEYEEPPVLISDEEYHLLFHERNVWVIYGRYKLTAILDDGTVLHAHVRGTYVWRMIKGELKLVHIHGSHAQDIPLHASKIPSEPLTENTDLFDYLKNLDTKGIDALKLSFRDREGNYRYLFPTDILYLKAAAQWSTVHTLTGSFQVFGLLAEFEKRLPKLFYRVHKSYLINSNYIESIHRYKAILKDGQELPISKERYMDLKRFLQYSSR